MSAALRRDRTHHRSLRAGHALAIEGHSLVSKGYSSTQQFVDEVLGPFAARFPAADPFRPRDMRAVHADGDTVIVLWDGRGIANDGHPYENSYAWFMTMRDDKVVDGTTFFDSISFNDLWERGQPRDLTTDRRDRSPPSRRLDGTALGAMRL